MGMRNVLRGGSDFCLSRQRLQQPVSPQHRDAACDAFSHTGWASDADIAQGRVALHSQAGLKSLPPPHPPREVIIGCGGPAGSGVTLESTAGVQERKGGGREDLKPGLSTQ